MTSFKQTRLLSRIVFLYERSMYPFHSSVARRQCLTEGVSFLVSLLNVYSSDINSDVYGSD